MYVLLFCVSECRTTLGIRTTNEPSLFYDVQTCLLSISRARVVPSENLTSRTCSQVKTNYTIMLANGTLEIQIIFPYVSIILFLHMLKKMSIL